MSFQKAEISSPASYAPIVKQTRYNQILKVGNRIDISGQGGWSSTIPEDGYKFEYKSLEEEIEQAFKNVELVLNSVGACWKNVKSVTSYHTNLEDTREKYMEEFPIWTFLGIEALEEPKMHVEIVVSAFLDE